MSANRAREIFIELVANVPPEQWEGRLAELAGEEPELRRKVAGLLAAHQKADSFLEQPAVPSPLPLSPSEGERGRGEGGTVDEAPVPGSPNAPPAEPRGTEQPGLVLAGRYKLLENIGEGGMGTVWMAQQTEPVKRLVAVKLVKTGMDSKAVLARFEVERQALALMDHPHIAKVLDAGAAPDGRPFFVMELVKGVPITRFCDERKLTPRQRLELFVPVCQAVQHAHTKGVIHRDLKPSNVLVALYDDRPVPKVIDFGVAKATGSQLTEQTLHTGFGTVEYMSPEQASFNQLDVDTRSDIYSLGVLLYELLTGSPPFTRKELEKAGLLEMLRVIREQEPSKPSTKLSTAEGLPTLAANRGTEPAKLTRLVRGELDWIVMKALEKDRNRRYETANGFAMDLQRYLADEPVQACPPSMGYRVRKFVRRNRAVMSVIALFAALLLVGSAVSTALAIWAIQAEGLAASRLEAAREAERERKRQLVQAKLAQARAGRWSRRPGQRFEGLKAVAEAAALARELGMDASVFSDLRDEAVACLALADVRPLKEWPGFPEGSTEALGFDADLERYARGDTKGDIEVRQVEGDRLLARLPGDGPGGQFSGTALMRFSPNAALLAATYHHQIPGQPTNCQVWDWQRRVVVFWPPFPVRKGAVAFSPDGRRLALGQDDGTVTVYAVDGWTEAVRMKTGSAPITLAFHPSGDRLAVAGQAAVEVRQLATGNLLYQVTTPRPFSVTWHPDGDLLAAGCDDSNTYLWGGPTSKFHGLLRGHLGHGIGAAFAADGDLVVSAGYDGSSRLWDPWTRRELLRFTGRTWRVSRDGRRIASQAGHTVTLWDVAPGREYLPVPPQPGTGGRVGLWDVSPDGRWLVAGGEPCRVWDLASRKEVATLPGGRVVAARFQPTRPEFFTSGVDGVLRWSFETSGGVLRIRPVDRLHLRGRLGALDLDRDGRQGVVANGWGAVVLDLSDSTKPGPSLEHREITNAALSPDGRWAATGTHNGFGVRVWDARTGKLEKELLPEDRSNRVAFSPDGRWLLIASVAAVTVWEPGTWRQVREIPLDQNQPTAAGIAFSPDGKVLAVTASRTTVRLFDAATWRPLARLEGPDTDVIEYVGFTPDGTRLLLGFMGGNRRVWDLRRVREQLAEMGLDWERPAYPPAPPTGDLNRLRVEVDAAAYERLVKADADQKK